MELQQAMQRDSIATAKTLSEALPYLQRYDGAIVVIKFGVTLWVTTPLWSNSHATLC